MLREFCEDIARVLILVALILSATNGVFAEETNHSFPIPPLQGSSQNWVRYDQNSVCWHKGGGVTDEYQAQNTPLTYYANLSQIQVLGPATACHTTVGAQGRVWKVWEASLDG